MEEAMEAWEGEGGTPSPLDPSLVSAGNNPEATGRQMTGTPSQIEWAEQIKPRVGAEFDRVAKALQTVASRQGARDRLDTQAMIAILEEKRAEVIEKDQAGYFIQDWQELRDQVRQMIGQDSRYQAIKAKKAARAVINAQIRCDPAQGSQTTP